ncbi:Ig-like domain-containing protein [Pedosphaera parvula]|nr:Ig-like domain-containing protein [Pedosphaera parvula]
MDTKLSDTMATAPTSVKTHAAAKVLNQWRGLRNWAMMAFLLLLLSMTGVVRAQVTNIIYQDNFARTGALNGSAPDTVNTPGANWFACNVPGLNAQLQTDGASLALTNLPGTTNGFYLNGFLPFQPQVGHIYYLSCNIKPLSGGTNWLALGFATHALTNNFFNTYQCGAGWLGIRGSGTNISPWGSIAGNSSFTNAIGNNFQLFTVVLDTTFGNGAGGLPNGNSQQGWQIRFYTNNVLVPGGNQTIAWGNYPIKYVGIGADRAQGNFQNFTLTDVLMRQGAPVIVEEPQNATAQVGQTTTFWVGVTNDYPAAAYQWMSNSTPIPGATSASYTTPTLDMSYSGLNYSVTITNANGSTNSSTAALTVVSGPPTVYSVTKTPSVTNLVVAFSKAVDPVTGLNPANYALIQGGVSIVSASYGSSSNNVILRTSTLSTNTGYYLKVQNVKDLYGNAMSTSTNAVLPAGLVFFVRADSGVVYDSSGSLVAQWLDQTTNANNASQFFGVPSAGPAYLGSLVRPTTSSFNNGQLALDFGNTSLPTAPRWLAAPSTPSLESLVRNTTMYAVARFTGASDELVSKTWGNLPAPFDWDPNPNENVQYGNGVNNAPSGGTAGTVSLNTPYVLTSMLSFPPENGLATNNFNFWLNGANNGSGSIKPLTGNPPTISDAGFPLWIGARWDLVNPRMRGQIAEILLFNTALSDADRAIVDNYLGIKYFTFAITTDLPASTTSSNGFAVTYTFVAGAGSAHGFSYQWQENGTNLPGATGSTYTTPILAPGDNGNTFDVQVTLPDGSHLYSTINTLTVLNVPPYVTSAGIPIWNTNQVVVLFDEAVNPATAAIASNYSLNNGASVLSAAMGELPNKVVLTTSPLSFNANPGFYSLTVQNVKDLYGNTAVTASTAVGLYPNAALWVRADTGVTTDAGTNTVNLWADLSGNNNNFFSGGGSTIQPQLVTNTWGDPVVRFNPTDTVTNYMATASGSPTLGITGDMSIIAVVNPRALNGRTGHIVSKTGIVSAPPTYDNIAAPYDFFLGTSGAQLNRGNGTGPTPGINYGGYTATKGPSVGYPSLVAVSETGNMVSHYLNGQAAGSDVLNSNFQESNAFDMGQQVFIGARSDGFNRLAGDLSELIVAASPLSSGEIAALGNYLSAQHHFVLFNSSPTNLVVSSSNNHLTFSWPVDHTGWQLQSNSVGLTATGSWYTVTGSTSTNQITITPDASKSSVFYRMIFPQP